MSEAEFISHGLDTVEKYYQEYGFRARELKKQGKQVIGYLCSLVPLEIIAAADLIPFRIKGNPHEPITKADTQMETIVCPLIRSCFDMALKGNYEFLDGLVIPHTCDSVSRTYDIWKYNLNLPYNHFLNVPHSCGEPSLEFFKDMLDVFRKSLEKLTGREISDQSINRAIQLYNQNRALMRELYELRKSDPPLISGVEMTKVLVAAMSLPVDECNTLLAGVIQKVKERKNGPVRKSARIIVIGAEVDDAALMEIIEESDANVVIDDLCIGTKIYWADVEVTDNPIRSLAERYLLGIMCPRTYRKQKGTYQEYLEERFGHIGRFIRDFKVGGAVLYIYQYCDPYGFEVPATKSYIESVGIPVL
ncbi:MAG: 2-hydroxyacyl-CoA dehydratase family protein, partial [Chloroflexi bacterium]|nr:2-hydroxyacyl-CoA dehydratase family protein [Chloroflexota bacterium]